METQVHGLFGTTLCTPSCIHFSLGVTPSEKCQVTVIFFLGEVTRLNHIQVLEILCLHE